ncbi:MAG: uracil-DNA glycosylase family protein, partial [Candidatus Obscuribacterales bacterium]|nr:uracil-DNA glycosylase family protein [Candidatus Obscuribacterales bacterium]
RLLHQCSLCPLMIGPVVAPAPIVTRIYLIGQAPGPHEGKFGRPFAWTAGKTLFRWFSTIGMDEEQFRSQIYMGAVCRCFPGKAKSGGDRVPALDEIANCSGWMKAEFDIFKPRLVIPVGKLAIEQVFGKIQLVDVIGHSFERTIYGVTCDVIPLPHPSGASTWFKKEPGISLLAKALIKIANHPEWRSALETVGSKQ